jgi:hypothetical protein
MFATISTAAKKENLPAPRLPARKERNSRSECHKLRIMKKLIIVLVFAVIGLNSFSQTAPSSLPELAQTLDQGKMNKKDCVMMVNGKMLMMVNGKTVDMTGDVKCKDGTVIQKNGTVTMPDGSTKAMKNGDTIDMDGKWERIDKKP